MNNTTRYFVVGLVIIVAILILIFGIYFLNDKDPRDRFVAYNIIFPKVGTLNHGDPVKVNGVKLGRVDKIELDGHRVKVVVGVKDLVKIPKNSVFKVLNIGIMGERQVGITLGDSKEYYKEGAYVDGVFDAGIAEVMGVAGEIMDSARVLITVVHQVIDSTIAQEEFKDSFRRIINKAENLEGRLDVLLKDSDPKIASTLNNLNTASIKINRLIDDNEQPIANLMGDAKNITDKGLQLMITADSLVNHLSYLTTKLQSQDNTLGMLINDDQLYKDLSSTVGSADSLLKIIIDDGLDVNIDFF